MKKSILAAIFLLSAVFGSQAKIKLPSVLDDRMVIQREKPIEIWGWADAGESFTLKWQNNSYQVTAGDDGRWQITLPQSPAGGPYTMTIGDITLKDILVGDAKEKPVSDAKMFAQIKKKYFKGKSTDEIRGILEQALTTWFTREGEVNV